jgi:hypothetical protein
MDGLYSVRSVQLHNMVKPKEGTTVNKHGDLATSLGTPEPTSQGRDGMWLECATRENESQLNVFRMLEGGVCICTEWHIIIVSSATGSGRDLL